MIDNEACTELHCSYLWLGLGTRLLYSELHTHTRAHTHTHTHTHTHSLSRTEILEELIGLIAREAGEDADDKVKYK